MASKLWDEMVEAGARAACHAAGDDPDAPLKLVWQAHGAELEPIRLAWHERAHEVDTALRSALTKLAERGPSKAMREAWTATASDSDSGAADELRNMLRALLADAGA